MEDYYLKLSKDWWKLQPNERRTLRQKQILKDWKKEGAKGFVTAVTGFGKTRIGENAIKECFAKDSNRIVNVVVPHNAAKEVWEKVKKKSAIKRIRVCMAQTYLKKSEEYRNCDLLIVDECHRFTNELAAMFGKVIDETKNKWVLPLSATLSDDQKRFLYKRGITEITKVTMKEARECGYVAEHYNWIVNMRLSMKDSKELDLINKEYHETWGVFNRSMKAVFASQAGGDLGKQTREYYANKIQVEPKSIYGLGRRAINSMNSRKNFFQKAPSKVDVACKIVGMFPGKNVITFGEYTDVSDKITEKLGPIARSYHTKLKSYSRNVSKYKRWKTEKAAKRFYDSNRLKMSQMTIGIDTKEKSPYYVSWKEKKVFGAETLKKENVDLFESTASEVRVLNTSQALDEAKDISNVEVAIILSYSSTPRQLVQRIGRIIRWSKGKVAHIFILVMTKVEGTTQEEKWLREALKEIDIYKNIKVSHLESIDYAS